MSSERSFDNELKLSPGSGVYRKGGLQGLEPPIFLGMLVEIAHVYVAGLSRAVFSFPNWSPHCAHFTALLILGSGSLRVVMVSSLMHPDLDPVTALMLPQVMPPANFATLMLNPLLIFCQAVLHSLH